MTAKKHLPSYVHPKNSGALYRYFLRIAQRLSPAAYAHAINGRYIVKKFVFSPIWKYAESDKFPILPLENIWPIGKHYPPVVGVMFKKAILLLFYSSLV